MRPAGFWIQKLQLTRHPEGGYYREVYRSKELIEFSSIEGRYPGPRNLNTAIYFLLEGNDFSAFHRLKSDEIWHFYEGSEIEIIMIDKKGSLLHYFLGRDPDSNHQLQAVIPAGTWFGARLTDKSSYALVGCTVAPGFDYADFEMGVRKKLLQLYPRHSEEIVSLTRDGE